MLFLAMSFLLIDNINLLGLVYIMTQHFLSFDKDNTTILQYQNNCTAYSIFPLKYRIPRHLSFERNV